MRPVYLFGPTAAGKTRLAIALAQRLGGEVVNADAMQLYHNLPILTAQPSERERQAVPHHLFGVWDGAQSGNLAEWKALADRQVRALLQAGKWPILVGGTGLYHQAFTLGLSPMPPVVPSVEAELRAGAETQSSAALYQSLQREDPQSAALLAPCDRQRILRALALWRSSGESWAKWRNKPRQGGWPDTKTLLLLPPRAPLYERINARFLAMMAAGALQEVERFMATAPPPSSPLTRALGLRPLAAYLAGEIAYEDALAIAQRDSRRYAKRQMTWARHQMPATRQLLAEAGSLDDWLTEALEDLKPSLP